MKLWTAIYVYYSLQDIQAQDPTSSPRHNLLSQIHLSLCVPCPESWALNFDHVPPSADGGRGGGGLSSLELFSMGLKATGCYMSRALSYKGATFDLALVDIDAIHRYALRPVYLRSELRV